MALLAFSLSSPLNSADAPKVIAKQPVEEFNRLRHLRDEMPK
jgi:hypothetical protein